MRLAYVGGPYRAKTIHGVTQNIRSAEKVAKSLWRLGYAVITPHKNTAYFDGAAPDEVWLEGGLEILSRCDLLVLAPGWMNSEGTDRERELAHEMRIPVYEWSKHKELLADAVYSWKAREERA